MSLTRIVIACGLTVGVFTSASAQQANSLPMPNMPMAMRWPQPVRVGDLPGRTFVQPIEAQHVLGHVAGVVRDGDGNLFMVVRHGGLFGIGARPIAVPIGNVILVGELVALVDITPAAFDSMPTFDPAGTTPESPDAIIRVGIDRPFH